MKVLIDTNVVLDVLLAREEHLVESQRVLSLSQRGDIAGCLCATTVTTLDYLVRRARGADQARGLVRMLLNGYEIVPVDEGVLRHASQSSFPDFEDAVIHAAALSIGAEGIVTRDRTGFRKATVPVLSPAELVATVSARPQG